MLYAALTIIVILQQCSSRIEAWGLITMLYAALTIIVILQQ